MTTLIAVAIACGLRDPAILSLLVLFQSGSGALGAPSLQAILPDLVPREELTAAVGLGITSWNSGRVIGPLLATALIPFGAQWAVAANGASFVVLWFAIYSCGRRFHPPAKVWMSARRELRAGFDALRRTPGCVAALGTNVTLHLVVVPFMGLIPATARALLERHGGNIDDATVTTVASRLLSSTRARRDHRIHRRRQRARAVPAHDGGHGDPQLDRRPRAAAPVHPDVGGHRRRGRCSSSGRAWRWSRACSARWSSATMSAVAPRPDPVLVPGCHRPGLRRRTPWSWGRCRTATGCATFVVSGVVVSTVVILTRRSTTWTNAIDGVEAPVPEPVVAAAFGG